MRGELVKKTVIIFIKVNLPTESVNTVVHTSVVAKGAVVVIEVVDSITAGCDCGSVVVSAP